MNTSLAALAEVLDIVPVSGAPYSWLCLLGVAALALNAVPAFRLPANRSFSPAHRYAWIFAGIVSVGFNGWLWKIETDRLEADRIAVVGESCPGVMSGIASGDIRVLRDVDADKVVAECGRTRFVEATNAPGSVVRFAGR